MGARGSFESEVSYFDEDENSVSPLINPFHLRHTKGSLQTGSLISRLSQNPQKFEGLGGSTLGVIVQTTSTIIAGSVLGLVFVWQIGLVGIGEWTPNCLRDIEIMYYPACTPALIAVGYVRLVSSPHQPESIPR